MAGAAHQSERSGGDSVRPGGWLGGLRLAADFAHSGETGTLALMGFLVRGGIVVVLLPAVVLPSLINVAAILGVRGISIEGELTPWLLELISIAAAGLLLWLLVAGWLASLADVWLIRLAARRATQRSRGTTSRGGLAYPPAPTLVRLVAIRVICLLPLGPSLAVAALQVYDAAYSELITPTELATPFVIRVVTQSWTGILAVALVWLAEETIAGIAVRREVLLSHGVPGSLVAAVRHVVRRPLQTVATVAVTYAGSILAIGLALAAMAVAFDWCRVAARNPTQVPVTIGLGEFATTRDFRPVIFAAAVVALALAWTVALAVSALTAAWRSGALTNEVIAGLPDGDPAVSAALPSTMLQASGPTAERSGD